MFRNSPDGDWQQCSIEEMSKRIIEMQAKILAYERAFDEIDRIFWGNDGDCGVQSIIDGVTS